MLVQEFKLDPNTPDKASCNRFLQHYATSPIPAEEGCVVALQQPVQSSTADGYSSIDLSDSLHDHEISRLSIPWLAYPSVMYICTVLCVRVCIWGDNVIHYILCILLIILSINCCSIFVTIVWKHSYGHCPVRWE